MRDKLAKIVHDPIYGSEADDSALHTADAIIAALPDMVVPLVWEKHPAGIMASTGQGTAYIVDDRNFRPKFIKWPSGNFAPDIGSLVEAKAATQADYTRRIMSALGITDKGEG